MSKTLSQTREVSGSKAPIASSHLRDALIWILNAARYCTLQLTWPVIEPIPVRWRWRYAWSECGQGSHEGVLQTVLAFTSYQHSESKPKARACSQPHGVEIGGWEALHASAMSW